MTGPPGTDTSYRDQLAGWVQALACARPEALQSILEEGSSLSNVDMFLESNRAGRRQKLLAHLDFVIPAFEDFEGLLDRYLRDCPLAAYHSIAADAERWLGWIENCMDLAPEQRDYVACQRARMAVETAARRNRSGHVQFQKLGRVTEGLVAGLGGEARFRIHLNPIRSRSRFVTTALLDEGAIPPADVEFFAVRDEIATAILEPSGRARIEELALCSPCTLDEWAGPGQHGNRAELAALANDLAGIGLVALEPSQDP